MIVVPTQAWQSWHHTTPDYHIKPMKLVRWPAVGSTDAALFGLWVMCPEAASRLDSTTTTSESSSKLCPPLPLTTSGGGKLRRT